MRTYPRFTQETLPQTLVLANGAFPTAPTPLALIDHWILGKEGYSLTCCDGAVNKLRRYTDRLPDAVIGGSRLGISCTQGSLSGAHPALSRSGTNDLTKTFTYLHSRYGKQAITLLGASGGREDHLLANLALLPTYAPLVEDLVMLTDEGYFLLITEPSTIDVLIGQKVSIFNFQRTPISLGGVRWPSWRLRSQRCGVAH